MALVVGIDAGLGVFARVRNRSESMHCWNVSDFRPNPKDSYRGRSKIDRPTK